MKNNIVYTRQIGKSSHKSKGFTLIEMAIVLIISSITMVYLTSVYSDHVKKINKEKMLSLWSNETMAIYDVIHTFVADNFDTIVMGRTMVITANRLVTGNYLPDGFANRNDSTSETPLGGKYYLSLNKYNYDVKGDGNPVPIVSVLLYVAQSGAELYREPKLAKIDIKLNAKNRKTVTKRIAYDFFNNIKADYVGGILGIADTWIDGVNRTFSSDFINFLGSKLRGRKYHTPVLLWGFPEINGCAGGVTCDGAGNVDEGVVDIGHCKIENPSDWGISQGEFCIGGIEPLYTTFPHDQGGFSELQSVDGFGTVGWSHSRESISVLGDFAGPSSDCEFKEDLNKSLGLNADVAASSGLACLNTVVTNKIDNLISGTGILGSLTYEQSGEYRWPKFVCASDPPNSAPACGGQYVRYSLIFGHKYFSICCTD